MWLLILFILFLILVGYAVYMFKLAASWYMFPSHRPGKVSKHISLTVIIPVRNESDNIIPCLESILKQDPIGISYEVVVSDDHSQDDTLQKARSLESSFKAKGIVLRILTAPDGADTGKKAALERAIQSSKSTHIVTTDADTTRGKQWLHSIASAFSKTDASMVVPFTELNPAGGFLNKVQALEFLGLTASSGASLAAGKPTMCNGANLAFSRKAFEAVGGYTSGRSQSSGDDTFLMLEMHRLEPGSVLFLKDPNATVTASAMQSWKEFLHQRVRWITKVKHYRSLRIRSTGLLVSGANAAIIALVIGWAAGLNSAALLLTAFALKSTAEFSLLKQAVSFAGRPRLLLLFLPAAVLTPFYFMASGWFLLFPGSYTWKGRTYRS